MLLTKHCPHCGSNLIGTATVCTACGSNELQNLCANCGTIFKTGFCPSCGVRAGAQPHICPECGASYFTHACPECGYAPTRCAGQQRYVAPTTFQPPEVKKKKSKVGTIILSIVFPYVMLPIVAFGDEKEYGLAPLVISFAETVFYLVIGIAVASGNFTYVILSVLSIAITGARALLRWYQRKKAGIADDD